MKIRIPNYKGEYKVVSLSLDERTKADLKKEDVDFILPKDNEVILFPDEVILTTDFETIEYLNGCNNYDVFEIWEDGTLSRCYDDSSAENTFFITEKCNSNCIMCPSPEYSRRRGDAADIDNLINIASHIPSDVSHITVTGGEPFMVGKDIFRLLDYCKKKFENTEFQILTNARIFAIKEYCDLLTESVPYNTVMGIPIHGSCEKIHDAITQSEGSFRQTIIGIKRLQAMGLQTEIRVVVNNRNIHDIVDVAKLIAHDFPRTSHVSIMGMEMTGNAYINRDSVWISYKESFPFVKDTIDVLINAGINTRLFNYPLCTVDRSYWTLCCRSISSWKVRFADTCSNCRLKDSCGGVFAGTINLEKEELEAII